MCACGGGGGDNAKKKGLIGLVIKRMTMEGFNYYLVSPEGD